MEMNKKQLGNSFLMLTFLVLLTVFLMSGNLREVEGTGSINWMSIDEAQNMAKKEPRNVFVDVYTTWCGPCKLMDRTTFTDEKVADYVKSNYYAVKLNAESDRIVNYKGKQISEREFAKSFQIQGYPTILLFDENFESATKQLGYMKAGAFQKLLEEFNKS